MEKPKRPEARIINERTPPPPQFPEPRTIWEGRRSDPRPSDSPKIKDDGFVNPKPKNLLPCPFCGKYPYECRDGNGRFKAKCYGCGVEMVQDRSDKLEGMWNRRDG